MHSYLLKKLLPFTLTFIVGAIIGGLFKGYGTGPAVWAWPGPPNATPLLGHEGPFGYGYDRRRSCRMYRRDLVAETKPLVILFKPDANYPRAWEGYRNSVWVRVTFGSDGKVQGVEQLQPLLPDVMLKAVDRAARQIQFTPEIVNGVPITVTKDLEIHFMGD